MRLHTTNENNENRKGFLTNVSKILESGEAGADTIALSPDQFQELYTFQSVYREGRSTETALLDVLDSIYSTADEKQVTVRNTSRRAINVT